MSYINECIAECEQALKDSDAIAAKRLVEDIVSVWIENIPRIKHGLVRYRQTMGGMNREYDWLGDLKKIQGKLINYRDKQPYSQVSQMIYDCESMAASNDIDPEHAKKLIEKVMAAYEEKVTGLGSRLDYFTWYRGDIPIDWKSDLEKIASQMIAYRESLTTPKEVPQMGETHVHVDASSKSISQNTINVSVEVSFEQTIEKISTLDTLSDNDKDVLIAAITTFDLAAKKDRATAEEPARKLLTLLIDKGFDVLLAVLPHMTKALGIL